MTTSTTSSSFISAGQTLPTVTVTGSASKPSMKVLITSGSSLVRFEASAPVSESRVANYEGFNIVHLPTSMWAYRNTNGRHFSISGRLVSRTPNEAKANAGYLTTVRSWVLPNFGSTGSTPPIVFLSGYSNTYLTEVPCVVLSYNWTFPDEVDYIFDTDEPMPVIGMLTIELEEAYSAEQITNGDWQIAAQSGGSFSTIGAPGSATVDDGAVITSPKYGENFGGIASSSISAGSFPTIGSALTSSSMTIAQTPVNSSIENSSLIISTSASTGLSNNRFISGSSVQNVLNNSTSTSTPTFVSNTSSTVDSFGRDSNFSIPVFGEY